MPACGEARDTELVPPRGKQSVWLSAYRTLSPKGGTGQKPGPTLRA